MVTEYGMLWHWVREREAIRIRKEEEQRPPPWTKDEILREYRFCNVRREDDRVTRWVREIIRKQFVDHPYLWFMLCVARQINWPETLVELMTIPGAWPADIRDPPCAFEPGIMATALQARAERGDKVFTGAYIITAPPIKGQLKTIYVALETLGQLWEARAHAPDFLTSLRRFHGWLTRFNGWGPFLAYQAVVDMRFTALLQDAPDVETWAAAGPGTIRGLNRLRGRALGYHLSQDQALSEMRPIYAVITAATGVTVDFSDIPNCLCEFDKYERVRLGQGTPRAKYVLGRGA